MNTMNANDLEALAVRLSVGARMLLRDPLPGEPFNKASWRNICPTSAAFDEAERLGLIVPVGEQFVHTELGKALRAQVTRG